MNGLDKKKKDEQVTGRNTEQGLRPLFPSAAMAARTSSLSSIGTALPASILEAESMGRERERRVRGFHFGDSGHGKRRWVAAAAAAMVMAAGSSAQAAIVKTRLGACIGGYGGAHLERN